jgi:hypothetical protein
MAEVYASVNGMSLERAIAGCSDAQDGVEAAANERAAIAHGILTAHRYSGDSTINVHRVNDLDWDVGLDDTAGQLAALSIEAGTHRTAGVHALSVAFDLAKR